MSVSLETPGGWISHPNEQNSTRCTMMHFPSVNPQVQTSCTKEGQPAPNRPLRQGSEDGDVRSIHAYTQTSRNEYKDHARSIPMGFTLLECSLQFERRSEKFSRAL
jgi:hypothetical protein